VYISKIREIFSPLMEKDNVDRNPTKYFSKNITLPDDDLNIMLELAKRHYDTEKDRAKNIETKSIVFISSISIIVTILLGVAKEYFFKSSSNNVEILPLFSILLTLIVVYFTRVIWFSIKALERQNYHILGNKDYLNCEGEYKKEIITKIANAISNNYATIDAKVDAMVMAQAYFKRAIITSTLSFIVLTTHALLKINPEIKQMAATVYRILHNVEAKPLMLINILILLFVIVVLQFLLIRRL